VATKTWNPTVGNLASNTVNWNGGSPGTGDDVVFDGTSTSNCTWDITTALNKVDVTSAYTGTVTQTAALNVNSGATQRFTFNGGTWDSGSSAVNLGSGGIDASGAATKILKCGSSTWSVTGNCDLSGVAMTFFGASSTFVFGSVSALTLTPPADSQSFNNISCNSQAVNPITVTLAGDVIVGGSFDGNTATTGGQVIFNGFAVHVYGDLKQTGTSTSAFYGTTVLHIRGSASQLFGTSTGNNAFTNTGGIVINKSGGTVTFYAGNITLDGNFTYTVGTTVVTGNNINFLGTSKTITSGSFAFNNVTLFTGGTMTLADNMTVNGTIDMGANSSGVAINGFKINLKGDLTRTVSSGSGSGTTVLEFNGTGTQTWSWASGVYCGFSVTINKSSGTLNLSGTIAYGVTSCTLTYTAGTVAAGSSTFIFQGSCTAAVTGLTFNNVQAQGPGTITTSGTVLATGTMTLGVSGNNYTQTGGTWEAQGHLTFDNSSGWTVNGTTLLKIKGAASQTLTMGLSGNSQTCGLAFEINKSGGTLTFVSSGVFRFSNHWTYTAGSLTLNTADIRFNSSGMTLTTNSLSLPIIRFSGAGPFTLADNLTVTTTLDLQFETGANCVINGSTIFAQGTVQRTQNSEAAGNNSGTTILRFSGSASQSFSLYSTNTSLTSLQNPIIIDKSGGTLTFATGQGITIGGAFTYIAGTINFNSCDLVFNSNVSQTVTTGGLSFPIFKVNGQGPLVLADDLTVTGTLDFQYRSDINNTINGSNIFAQGDVVRSRNSAAAGGNTGGTTVINFTGSASQSFSLYNTAFVGSNYSLNNPVIINKTGGTLTFAAGPGMYFGGNFTYTAGTVDTSTSEVGINAGASVVWTVSTSISFYKISIRNSGTITVSGTMVITNTFRPQTHVVGNFWEGGTVHCKGDIDCSLNGRSYFLSGTVTQFIINGTGAQLFTGNSTLTNVGGDIQINKPSGTLTFSGTCILYRNLTHVAGTVDFGTSTVVWRDVSVGPTITSNGSLPFNNIDFTGGLTYTITGDMTVNGALEMQNQVSTNTINGSKILAKGDVTKGAAGRVQGSATLEFSGTATQTWSMTGGTALEFLNTGGAVIINKTGGTLNFSGSLAINCNFTYTAGTVAAGSSTMIFRDSHTITASGMAFNHVTFQGGNTFTLGSSMTVNGTLITSNTGSNTTFTGAFTINAKGDVSHTNAQASVTGGVPTLEMNGTGAQAFTGSASGFALNLKFIINKSAGTLTFSSTCNFGSDWTHTTGTVDFGTSTIHFSGTMTLSPNAQQFNNVSFFGTITVTLASDLIILGTTNMYADGSVKTINSNRVRVRGTTIGATSSGQVQGTAIFTIDGTGAQTFSTGTGLWSVPTEVNKASGTLTLSGSVSLFGNWTHVAGTVDFGTSTFTMGAITVTSNTMQWNNLTFNGAGPAFADTATVNGTLNYANDGSTKTNVSGSVSLKGDLTKTGSGGGGTGTITLNGSGTSQVISTAGAGSGIGMAIVINKTTGSVTFSGTVRLGGSFTYTTAGSVVVTGSTILVTATSSFDSGGISWNNWGVTGGTTTLTNHLTISGNLASTGGTLTAGSFTITVAGNWGHAGTFNGGTGTVILNAATCSMSGSATFNILTLNGTTYNVTAGTTQTINGSITCTGSAGAQRTFQSATPGSIFSMLLSGDHNFNFTNIRDCNCSFSGKTGRAINGNLTNCTNWNRGDMAYAMN